MLTVLLLAQISVAQANSQDSLYSTEALRVAIAVAATVNREAPRILNAYAAHVESEIGLIVVDTIGRERTGQIEQIGSRATWSRDSGYTVHVLGYRTQSAGLPISMVGLIKGWSLPMLYGERLLLGVEGNAGSRIEGSRRGGGTDSLMAVHPFAEDREQYYSFTGGDTVAVLVTDRRRIALMRIRATPHFKAGERIAAFDGEIDIDADTHEIVRMRGRFVVSAPPRTSLAGKFILKATGTVGVAYAEFVNADYNGYWLPATQRIEFQASIALFAGMRSVFRVVSRFSEVSIDDTTLTAPVTPVAAYTRRQVTFAASDSLSAFADWRQTMGASTAAVGANDFDDVAPPAWMRSGPPRVTAYPSRVDRMIHYNRIEGLYTGAEISAQFRDLAPGVTARAFGGWGWASNTVRGGVSLKTVRGKSTTMLLADRSLVSTGDFRSDLEDGGSSVGAFVFSIEEVDYVDRWRGGISNTQILGSLDRGVFVTQIAIARDVDVPATITHGPIRTSTLFLPNRHAATGTYGLAAATYEFHPNVSGDFLSPGIGSRVYIEAAKGALTWLRSEVTLSARQYAGPLTLAATVLAGATLSNHPPPQTLFELGGSSGILSGYRYKEFAGDRAAAFNGSAAFGFPLWRAPHHIRRLLIPGASPGIEVGMDGGWTGVSSSATTASILAMGDGTAANAVSRASRSVRSAAFVAATFFSHSIQLGVARPVDHPAPWRLIFGIGKGR